MSVETAEVDSGKEKMYAIKKKQCVSTLVSKKTTTKKTPVYVIHNLTVFM